MPDFLPATVKDYRSWVESRGIKDPIERALVDISEALQKAWTGSRCLTCPVAELTALAAATLALYREQRSCRS
jgi:hypothetical protein